MLSGAARSAYNAAVPMRLAVDARKLTDFGIGTYLSHLLEGLAASPEIRLTVIARSGHEERLRELAPDARVVACAADGYSLAEQVQLPSLLGRERVDLVHLPHYTVPLLMPCRFVVTVHDVIHLYYPPRPRPVWALAYLRLVLGSALRRARCVITPSRSSRGDLVKLFGADPRRLRVVPEGVDAELGRRPPAERLEALKESCRLRPPLVLVVGNDKPHKNLDFVLRAYHHAVREHRVPGQLVLVGAGERLLERAERLGLGGRVRCLGRVPRADLHAVYHMSAVLLHVSLYEGFGLPILEAMGAGLPVITSNLGAMRELGEGAARLVNPLDLEEVSAAIERVLVDDPLRRRMVDAGRRRAEKMTWTTMVEQTVAAYRLAAGEERS